MKSFAVIPSRNTVTPTLLPIGPLRRAATSSGDEILVIFSIGATDHPSLRVGGGALTTLTDRRYPRQIIFNIQLLSAHPGPVVGQSPALSPRAPGSGVSVAPEKCLRMIQCEQKDECR